MSAVRSVLKKKEGREELKEQMDKCPTVCGRQRDFVMSFLVREGIFSLESVTDEIKHRYRMHVKNSKELSAAQKRTYLNSIEPFVMYFLMDDYPEIRDGVILNGDLDRCMRNKIGLFLMENGIGGIDRIEYGHREKFESYLYLTVSEKKAAEYLKGMDKLKLKAIKEENGLKPFVQHELKYDGKKLFLCYHPDYDTAMSMYYWQDKSELVYDFTAAASETVCRQMVDVLNWVFSEQKNLKIRHDMYLLPLNRFFRYCIEHRITDIELMDAEDMLGYRESIVGHAGTKENEYIQIVNIVQRFLFCNDRKTRWDASSWFLERFDFKHDRMNPARPVSRLSFWQVRDNENREMFKAYVRYELGLTNMAVENIRAQYYEVKEFLLFCDTEGIKVCGIGRDVMDAYADYLGKKEILPQTFNKGIVSVFRFWNYLSVTGRAEKPKVTGSYYLKKCRNSHHDLSVSEEDRNKVVDALIGAPEHLRLMFLNLWATGSRINEICTIKADAYSLENGKAFMRICQYKMKKEKVIPIPIELYRVMTEYIERIGKKNDEFVFTKRDGVRAYDPGTFSKQMKKALESAGVSREEYNFRAHGYRHGVGTRLYMAGVAVQVIRDYMGHNDENMTKQYIDHADRLVMDASREYFEKIGNKG